MRFHFTGPAPLRLWLPLLLGLALLPSQVPAQSALPEFLKFSKLPGMEVRFVDFGWAPEAFAAMEAGGTHPAAQRSWMLAVLSLNFDPRRWEGGRVIPVGASVLVLNPARAGKPMTLELRFVDVRRAIFEPNVVGIPPEGETVYEAAVPFETVAETKERLDVALVPAGDDAILAIHYGNRKASIKLLAH